MKIFPKAIALFGALTATAAMSAGVDNILYLSNENGIVHAHVDCSDGRHGDIVTVERAVEAYAESFCSDEGGEQIAGLF